MKPWCLHALYLAALARLPGAAAETDNDQPMWPLQSFKSTPIQAPYMNVTKHGQTELGYLFISPHDMLRETGYPMIYDDDGQLVWRGPQMNISAYQPQMLDGEPVLAYWNGYLFPGFGYGGISIVNSSYDEIYRVTLPGKDHKFLTVADPQTFESYIDIHESQITDQGTMLVTAVNNTQMDLSSLGGPEDGWVQDGLFYEIDIKTNEVLFRWSTVEHVSELPFSDIVLPLNGEGENGTEPFEYPHLNSVAKYGDSYLVSSRYMCSLFFIDKNGNVTWNLHGQKGGSFTLAPEASFCFQHDARFISQTDEKITLQLHNNENAAYTSDVKITTGLILELDLKQHTASAVQRFWDAEEPVFGHSQGSYQNLTNGHVLLQHGSTPKLEEYDEEGALVMSARFGYDETLDSYRGYRAPWVGRPRTVPDVAACVKKGKTVVYVSWNGATDVQSWKVMAAQESDEFEKVDTVPRNGFETEIRLDAAPEKVFVEAVGGVGDGRRSEVVSVGDRC